MRIASLLTLLLVTSGSAAADLIPAEYVTKKYVAPDDAPSSIVVAGPEEPGERFVVTGRVLDGNRPLARISIYVFHTDADGRYARDGVNNDENARLHGAMRSDAEGRYRFETIRPRGYDGEPAHVHYVVIAPGYKPRMFDLWLADDPILEQRRKDGLPELWFESAPGRVAVRPVTRDAKGTWQATRDLEMLRQ
jgi:protocatechuate 3,4-dioxygenase beta subunit